ncbi:putative Gnk2-like domain-containing protein [Helianthus annuus]|uniref:cysteine-rich repeat secretory protein 1-like n=1 Tax=Helianthus annuus TaxID=4232 RepID=UPI000B9089E5|nr:cysteine-rich repeat secretory protein 1-like [Helianthus annuus]KAJ0575163.1 putative Gnk2-like domain-containing protein [Helianthus annuus]KAJ0583122.1 putative Gnk2-like domain-containing protein [Helianthus annuus]KAJ0917261.1 putative Gnk2-like domain-containing protein [Helianthus annuus]
MEMKSIILFLIIIQSIINGVNLAKAPTTIVGDWHVSRGGDFRSNTIQKNRDSVLDKLLLLIKNNSSYNGFYHTQSAGKPEEQVSASFFCALNVVKGLCECCLRNVVQYIQKNCQQQECVAWDFYPYLQCMVRYSTGRKIFSVLDDWAWKRLGSGLSVSTANLAKTMDSMINKLKVKAAGGDALRKYASDTIHYDGDEHALYADVQCTPDLTKEDCLKCLTKGSNEIRNFTRKPRFSGRVISTNCYVRYDHTSIFNPPTEYSGKECG